MLTPLQIFFVSPPRRLGAAGSSWFLFFLLFGACGCSRFRPPQHETVYVSARQMYLHDRVAAVSNRVAEVVNGQPLEILEHGRRFLKVKTQKNEIGWIEEHAVIDSKIYGAFTDLASKHKDDPVVATATLRDDLYLHVLPGRETEHFYLLAGNAKVQLLARASVPKTAAPATGPVAKPAAPKPGSKPGSSAQSPSIPKVNAPRAAPPVAASTAAPPPIVMEDWWLVRDAAGHAGWMLATRLDVDVPDSVGVYAEGQRMVGAYILTKIKDPEADTPDHEVPEYVTVLSPPGVGEPFDFDQVRVFTWSLKRHRYETAFRIHPIQGYLPVQTGFQPGPTGNVPVFSFQIAGSPNLNVDPATGMAHPASMRTIHYMMNDTLVKRIGPDMGPIPVGHLESDKPKAAKTGKKNHK